MTLSFQLASRHGRATRAFALTDGPSPARGASSHSNRLDKIAPKTAIGTTHDVEKYNPRESNRNVPVEKKTLEHTHKIIKPNGTIHFHAISSSRRLFPSPSLQIKPSFAPPKGLEKW
jgi:tRNA G37 N-methylase Trm5